MAQHLVIVYLLVSTSEDRLVKQQIELKFKLAALLACNTEVGTAIFTVFMLKCNNWTASDAFASFPAVPVWTKKI